VSDLLADMFETIADAEGLYDGAVIGTALAALSDGDGVLRASAARALTYMDPKRAAEVLPQRLLIEQNRTVAATFKSLLRVLELNCPHCGQWKNNNQENA
jgi:HEAT repeat protein